jgi:hypothetical protein
MTQVEKVRPPFEVNKIVNSDEKCKNPSINMPRLKL